jgi:rhodanese-related sulfurtransferase
MKKIIFLFLLAVVTYYGWKKWYQPKISSVQNTEVIEKKTTNHEKPEYYLINVLEKEDFDDAHIKGSIHVSMADIDAFLKKIEHHKEVPLIFYCSNYYCTSSDLAAQKAIKKGFQAVSVYKGGIAEWFQKNKSDPSHEIEGPCQMPYLQFVIIPEFDGIDPLVDVIDEDIVEDNEKIKIITINDLQKILKKVKL